MGSDPIPQSPGLHEYSRHTKQIILKRSTIDNYGTGVPSPNSWRWCCYQPSLGLRIQYHCMAYHNDIRG